MKKSELRQLVRECVKELNESPIDFNKNKPKSSFTGKIIYKSEDTLVLQPKTFDDMRMISLGTRWSIGIPGTSYFDNYSKTGKIFVISDKSRVPVRKWALYIPNDGTDWQMTEWKMYDKDDMPVDVNRVLGELQLSKTLFKQR